MNIRDEFILAILDDMKKHMANATTEEEKAFIEMKEELICKSKEM